MPKSVADWSKQICTALNNIDPQVEMHGTTLLPMSCTTCKSDFWCFAAFENHICIYGNSVCCLCGKRLKSSIGIAGHCSIKHKSFWDAHVQFLHLKRTLESRCKDSMVCCVHCHKEMPVRSVKRHIGAISLWLDDDKRNRMLDARRTPEAHSHYVMAGRASKSRPDVRKKISETTKAAMRRPSVYRRMIDGHKRYVDGLTEEDHIKLSESHKAAFRNNPSYAKAVSEGNKKHWESLSEDEKKQHVRRRQRGHSSFVHTKKGGSFYVDSTYESRFVACMDSDDSILSFVREPFPILYELNGESHRYYPDFLVHRSDGDFLIEVKSKWWLMVRDDVTAKSSAADLFVKSNGLSGYIIVTEDDISKYEEAVSNA